MAVVVWWGGGRHRVMECLAVRGNRSQFFLRFFSRACKVDGWMGKRQPGRTGILFSLTVGHIGRQRW